MKQIEVEVLHEAHECPAGMMMFLARLTQSGHKIKNMEDLLTLYDESMHSHKTAASVARMPHGTIKRFTPITVAIVGASRRFLAQARTNQVGANYVSASLQYSDYSGTASFVVPYAITEKDEEVNNQLNDYAAQSMCSLQDYDISPYRKQYLESCEAAMSTYNELAEMIGNDAAGYAAPMGLRNILIMQMNHEAWLNFIRLRACSRNTNETQYVTLKIWEALLNTQDGEEMFAYAGPDCVYGMCREGKMSCGNKLTTARVQAHMQRSGASLPSALLHVNWPLLREVPEIVG